MPIRKPRSLAGRVTRSICVSSMHLVYAGAPHGMCSTHVAEVNADLLAFLKG